MKSLVFLIGSLLVVGISANGAGDIVNNAAASSLNQAPGASGGILDSNTGQDIQIQGTGGLGQCCLGLDFCADVEEEGACDLNAYCYWLCDDVTEPPKTQRPTPPPPPPNPNCRCRGQNQRCAQFGSPQECRRNAGLGCSFSCINGPPGGGEEGEEAEEEEVEEEPEDEVEEEPEDEVEEVEGGDVTERLVFCDTDEIDDTAALEEALEEFLGIAGSGRILYSFESPNADDPTSLDVLILILEGNPSSPFLQVLLEEQLEAGNQAGIPELEDICDWACERTCPDII